MMLRSAWKRTLEREPEALLDREWLVTNGLGGYASGSISGACTRRFHGLLIAALPSPLGRVMLLNHLMEEVRLSDGSVVRLGGEEQEGGLFFPDAARLASFRLEFGLPVWSYDLGEAELEKRLLMPHRVNATYVLYRLVRGSKSVRLRLRPSLHFRPHHGRVDEPINRPYPVVSVGDRHEFRCDPYPPLQLRANAHLVLDGGSFRRLRYRTEEARGYDFAGTLWSPGYFRADLAPGEELTLVAGPELPSASGPEALEAELTRRKRLLDKAPDVARHGLGAEMVLAADQFLIAPATRPAEGAEAVTVIAGYPWFTDWGRDTMISLEGLTLGTGRHREAAGILTTFARYVRDGLLPNQFPEGQGEGIYNTADATLWFFHAIDAYGRVTGDHDLRRSLAPVLRAIVDHHRRGTRFGIRVDPGDGLRTQGQAGFALTWMDAKLEDWVVTPRRGKAVEINALWYNALRLMEVWGESAEMKSLADQVQESFNRRFWNEAAGHLYDVVDGEGGDDASLRPNQILALSLPHPVLDPSRWKLVLTSTIQRLLTPVGLRSLAPDHPSYQRTYEGNLRIRDGAYHQGTVWAWLVGPLVDAWLRVYPEDAAGARRFLDGFEAHLDEGCVGSVSEIFDAEPPFRPRGCFAQAWSVAEILRAWIRTSVAPLQHRERQGSQQT
jgi:predicted glycogen debranching enzyme